MSTKKKNEGMVRDIAFTSAVISQVFFPFILAKEKDFVNTYNRVTSLALEFYRTHRDTDFYEDNNRFSPAATIEKWVAEQLKKYNEQEEEQMLTKDQADAIVDLSKPD